MQKIYELRWLKADLCVSNQDTAASSPALSHECVCHLSRAGQRANWTMSSSNLLYPTGAALISERTPHRKPSGPYLGARLNEFL